MAKPTDQETTATEKVHCYSQFLKGGGTVCHAGPHGEAPGLVRRPMEQGGKIGKSLLLWFPGERPGNAG